MIFKISKKFLLFIFFISIVIAAHAQQQDSVLPNNNKTTKLQKYVLIGLAAHQTANFIIQYNWWWKGQEKKFNVENDHFFDDYSLGTDKFGHFYTSYYYYHAVNELMLLAKYNDKTRAIISTTLPIVWAISIEMGDGFSPFGFSFYDLTSNMLGLSYAILQRKYQYLQNFKIKMGYYPTAGYIDAKFRNWALSDDYSGHIYWLTFDMHNLVPQRAKKYFPPFLNVAVGYGVDNYGIHGNLNEPMQRKFCIGFDWNLSSIKSKNKYINTTKNILDYIHLPAPGTKYIEGKPTENKILLLN